MHNQNKKLKWIVFTSVLLTYLLMSSQRTAPGLITEQMMIDFNITAVTVGLLISIQFFVYTVLQIPMGILVDRYGPNLILISGAMLTGIGTIIYSVSKLEFFLFFARILTGVGDATVWVSVVLILGQWFTGKEFTRLIGIASLMGNMGYLMATVPFSLLIDSIGWRLSFLSAGLLLCLFSIFLYIILIQNTKRKLFRMENIKREKTWKIMRRILSKRHAWALFFCHFGVVGAYVGFISSWGVPYAMNVYNMSRSDASQLMMIGLAGALIGSPLASWIANSLQTIKKPYIIFHLLLLASWSVFLFFHGRPPFYLTMILFFIIGLAYGSNTLTFAIVRQSFPIKEAGIVSGYANTGGFLGAILLPSIFGKVLDHFAMISNNVIEGYFYGLITPVIFSIIGLLGVAFLSEK